MSLNKEQHRNRHVTLHNVFGELLTDFIMNTKSAGIYVDQPIRHLLQWSQRQTVEPDHEESSGCGEEPA